MRNNTKALAPWSVNESLWPSDWFGGFFNDSLFPSLNTGMKADIKELDDSYVIDLEVPGLKQENLELDLTDNRLTVTAHINESSEEKGKDGQYLRRERRSGVYRRSFILDNVKTEEIGAKLNNGVLTITCPKAEQPAEPCRKIEIQ